MSKGLGIIRRCKALVLAAGLIAAIAPATASAADFSVNDDTVGSGPPGANCAAAGFTTVAAAVAAAAANGTPGDRVLVCAGTYEGAAPVAVSENLQLLGPQVGVDARSRSGAEATLDGFTSGTTFTLNTSATVDGFRILGGAAPAIVAAGAAANAKVVQNNLFDQTQVALSGVFGNNSVFQQNRITEAVAQGVDINGAAQSGVQVINNAFVGVGSENIIFRGTGGTAMTSPVISGNTRSGGTDNFLVLFNTDGAAVASNTLSAAGAGGVLIGGGSAGTNVTGNSFTGNATAVDLNDFLALGPNTLTTVTGNTMLTNTNAVIVRGGDPGSSDAVQVHFNRFRGNTQAILTEADSVGGSVDATNNWFGCNAGPGTAGCDTVSAAVTGAPITTAPFLVLALSANPPSFELSGSAAMSASLTGNSAGAQVGPGFPNGTIIAFATDFGTITPTAATAGGIATATLTAGALGTANVTSTLDNQTVGTTATVTPDTVNVTTGTAKKCKKAKAKANPAAKKKKKCKKKKKK